jgi:D-alanine-D-alanine ligase
MNRRLRVLVLCGGPSTEHDVSLRTARMVVQHLDRKKYAPVLGVIGKDGVSWSIGARHVPSVAATAVMIKKFDFVFIAMHGAYGEDGRMQALLEWIGVPYSGSGVASSAMAMDKQVSNILYEARGMNVPTFLVVDKEESISFSLPAVVKPLGGGSSVGVSIVKKKKDLKVAIARALRRGDRVMIQKYIAGREFTCGVIEDAQGKPFALPPTEIIPRSSTFFDYQAKYQRGGSEEITPAKITKSELATLQKLALKAHIALGCKGMSRSDFILSGDRFFILETNTIPGMTETSLLPQAAAVAGISFPKLLDMIINSGRKAKRV